MQAIRKEKVKRIGRQITVELPDDFKAEEVDLIIWPSTDEREEIARDPVKLDKWREELKQFYSTFNVDLSNFKFNRDELYDRP